MAELIRMHCRHCGQTYLTTTPDLQQCDLCHKVGGLVRAEAEFNEEAQPAQGQRKAKLQAQPKGDYPVSRACPSCGGLGFRRMRPDRWVAFTQDRVCKACGTRYTPPTPIWAGIVLLLAGLVLLSIGVVGGVFSLIAGDVAAVVCEVFLLALGLLAVGQGFGSLIRPGKV
jgi:hypothetical protein